MVETVQKLKVFISSPGDVKDERAIAAQIIRDLNFKPEFRGHFLLEPLRWDDPEVSTPISSHDTPQRSVDIYKKKPSECHLVLVIFWSRMGTPLEIDGVHFLSGTHYEWMDAIEHATKSKGIPEVWTYRRIEDVPVTLNDPDLHNKIEQKQVLDNFFKDEFEAGNRRGYNPYASLDDFRRLLQNQLEVYLRHLRQSASEITNSEVTPQKLYKGSPFPGLRSFTEDDVEIFFGRMSETDSLLHKIENNHFVAVVAASGSGKSSLVRAGIIPRLKSRTWDKTKIWYIGRFTPAENPFEGLYDALRHAFNLSKPDLTEAIRLKEQFIADVVQDSTNLFRTIEQGINERAENAKILFFIDQFEELFTLTKKHLLPLFVEILAQMTKSEDVHIVVTLRADFYHRMVEIPELANLLQAGTFPLTVPKRDALRQMIEHPANRVGIELEEGLVDIILDDTGDEPGNLALMAYALDELYKTSGNTMTIKAYNDLGGVKGAIGKRAEKQWSNLQLGEDVLYQVFKRLVEVDERGVVTRKRSLYRPSDNSQAVNNFIDAFVEARLLTVSYDSLEVAHEAILREWKSLADWIEERQEDLRIIARMRRDAEWWFERGKQDQDLPRAEQYDEFTNALNRLRISLDPNFDASLIEFARDEREEIIQTLSKDEVSDEYYTSLLYRFREIQGDEVRLNIAIVQNVNHSYSRRESAVRILGELQDNRAVKPLIRLLEHEPEILSDEDIDLRVTALASLGQIHDFHTIEAISRLLNSQYERISLASLEALLLFTEVDISEYLQLAMQSQHVATRIAMLSSRNDFNIATILPSIVLGLKDADKGVRSKAMDAITKINNDDAKDAIVNHIKSLQLSASDITASRQFLRLIHAIREIRDEDLEGLINEVLISEQYQKQFNPSSNSNSHSNLFVSYRRDMETTASDWFSYEIERSLSKSDNLVIPIAFTNPNSNFEYIEEKKPRKKTAKPNTERIKPSDDLKMVVACIHYLSKLPEDEKLGFIYLLEMLVASIED